MEDNTHTVSRHLEAYLWQIPVHPETSTGDKVVIQSQQVPITGYMLIVLSHTENNYLLKWCTIQVGESQGALYTAA